jgi:hypothetical protein
VERAAKDLRLTQQIVTIEEQRPWYRTGEEVRHQIRPPAAVAALVGVDLVDHLVLGAGGHSVSLWARGDW